MNKLAEFQQKLKAPKGQYNSFGKYKYRSAEDILEAVKQVITPEGYAIIISDEIVLIGDRHYVKAKAILLNSDGEKYASIAYAREEDTKKGMDASQITGAASSYARKYALNGLFAIDDTKDSDATNNGEDKPKEEPKPQPKTQKEILTEDHPNFDKVVDFVKNGGQLTEVMKKYTIDRKTESLIINKL